MTTIAYNDVRTPDTQYLDMLRHIRTSSETFLQKHPYQERGRFTNLDTQNLVYYFRNGFPVCTERKIGFWKKPITELLLFMRGVHHVDKMIAEGCDWWKEWVSAEKCATFGLNAGDLGPGSYGPVLSQLPYVIPGSGGSYALFDQVAHLVQSLKDGPALSTHVISTWCPPLAMGHSKHRRKVVVAPCHGTIIQCTVIDGKKLCLTMVQRSGDVPVGVISNIIQYAALTVMLAHVCGYEPYEYIHKINDAQIYENQIECVDKLLDRDPFPFPTLHLTDEGQKVDNVFDFIADHFELRDYQYHPGMKIPYTL